MPLQSATWTALALVLTVIGAAYTYGAWHRRGVAAGVRGLAWTLLPLAAWLTGTLRLAGRIVDAVTSWAASLVFNPFTWLGILVAGVSVVLFGASAAMRRRGIGARAGTPRRPAVKPSRDPRLAAPARQKGAPAVDDLSDIEAILRKHGIS